MADNLNAIGHATFAIAVPENKFRRLPIRAELDRVREIMIVIAEQRDDVTVFAQARQQFGRWFARGAVVHEVAKDE